jgi:hypothetical protein
LKTNALAAILTVPLLLIISIVFFFVEMIALNGVSDSRGSIAMGLLLVFQIGVLVFAGMFAGWACKALTAKFRWKPAAAVAVSVLAAAFLGTLMSFFSIILSILLAGIK